MPDEPRFASLVLQLLLPRLEARLPDGVEADAWRAFVTRLERHFARLLSLLDTLYGQRDDFLDHLESILWTAARMWLTRPADLRVLDRAREADPRWYQSNQVLGGVCYVDRFAGDLDGIRARIPYFKELGLSYLHLMPLFRSPEGDNDGGYAVSSYRDVHPALGSMHQLAALARALRSNGISLVLDFVFNHTSDEHAWALKALAGDPVYRDFYYVFPDRRMPDAYEAHLREIFPDEHPGAFTYRPEIDAWVWTTFHTYQWDLNYSNPAVFEAMAEEMLFLANAGVEVLRLDAVAFIGKRLGTGCENLPEAHTLIQAFNAVARIAAPALLFKSEAIVHPDEVVRYIGVDECPLSYNPLLMALLWNSLATRKTRLLSQAMRDRFAIDPRCAWVNYVRCHDDIGWTFSDEDAALLGVKGFDHRRFLNAFYTGRFEGSFARGLPFQENPKTGDARLSGTCASLAGLEKALAQETPVEVELAVRRIVLLHSIILSIGGIPLIYLGDEIGTLNDYRYRDDPATADDSRWVHRPRMDWDKAGRRGDANTVEGQIYGRLRHLVDMRRRHPALAVGDMDVIDTGNVHVFGYARRSAGETAWVWANFSEHEQTIAAERFQAAAGARRCADLISGEQFPPNADLALAPYQVVWLVAQDVNEGGASK